MDLRGRHIVLGVTGGIAAYKAVEVCRRLVDLGAFVSPILTANAQRFIGAVTFSAVASEPARTELWDPTDPSPHTRLGQSADLVLVVPATAHLLAAYANGFSSDLLTATLLATRAPVMVCPAMHTEMWEHSAVQENVAALRRRGVAIVAPESGHLAGGDQGIGRLAEPATIVDAARNLLAGSVPSKEVSAGALTGMRVLITAGGTREPIDPVRFLGNRSSGKQGHALAAEAASLGAEVTLVTTSDRPTPVGAHVIPVETAAQMHDAVCTHAPTSDIVVMAAAVADFRPVEVAPDKLKKAVGVPEIELEPTTDILAELTRTRVPGQTIVGFAAETDDVLANAADKLRRKGLDLIVANDVGADQVGFSHDTNAVEILTASGASITVPLRDKRAVAAAVFDAIIAVRSTTSTVTTPSEQPIPRSST